MTTTREVVLRKVSYYNRIADEYRVQAETTDNEIERQFLLEVAQRHQTISDNWKRNHSEFFTKGA